jgi:hypothetical protein
MRFQVAVLTAAVALAVPAASQAKVVTYGGALSPGGGRIALDVAVDKRMKPRKVVAIRAVDIPVTCEISKTPTAWTDISRLSVRVKDGGFGVTFVDPKFGNKKRIDGTFRKKGRRVAGAFTYSNHFPAEGDLPEEDCKSDPLTYSARRGGRDAVPPRKPPRG